MQYFILNWDRDDDVDDDVNDVAVAVFVVVGRTRTEMRKRKIARVPEMKKFFCTLSLFFFSSCFVQ